MTAGDSFSRDDSENDEDDAASQMFASQVCAATVSIKRRKLRDALPAVRDGLAMTRECHIPSALA